LTLHWHLIDPYDQKKELHCGEGFAIVVDQSDSGFGQTAWSPESKTGSSPHDNNRKVSSINSQKVPFKRVDRDR
jgi:hypothetical protein